MGVGAWVGAAVFCGVGAGVGTADTVGKVVLCGSAVTVTVGVGSGSSTVIWAQPTPKSVINIKENTQSKRFKENPLFGLMDGATG